MKTTKKILLIEDDKDDQRFFIEALSEILEVRLFGLANNGKEALEQLEKAEILPDLIFTDINMPIMGGIECFSEILNNPRIKNIPVVFLTNDMARIKDILQLGAKTFINKPSDERILCQKIRQAIQQELKPNLMPTGSFFKGLSNKSIFEQNAPAQLFFTANP
ncbi:MULTISPECIES: response regulator [unclassified Arcicella]|uniref:response regulator n=1 Tax=unclassified Arcicella TaxID=2644986 RepID=UPI002855BA63|nr:MULTISPECIES: response regulator [unclassified Arcicella]MDR6564283.1 CheY-like chemotaxis protein [Arcicella sp. BE51]MDR6811470.1 CheY-like chemotaxis protein [Arcicella sp. BE140]MDR6826010.1 CheY-like chemotaxis protein [Arcicella sp. BE139]